jgi:hypothetical protein
MVDRKDPLPVAHQCAVGSATFNVLSHAQTGTGKGVRVDEID